MANPPQNRAKTGRFGKGMSGNPGGRPKLPEELRAMKDAILERALSILYEKIHDDAFINKLSPSDLDRLLQTSYDRCGLPKVTKDEHTIGVRLEDILSASRAIPVIVPEPIVHQESSGKLLEPPA